MKIFYPIKSKMDFNYKLYNIKSSAFQDSIPQSPAQNEVWIKFAGVKSEAYNNADNYNKTIWLRFNTSDLRGVQVGKPILFGVSAALLNVAPGIITASDGNSKVPGTFLVFVPTLPGNTDIEFFLKNTTFTYTLIIADPNNVYRLLLPPENLVYYNNAPGQSGPPNPTFISNFNYINTQTPTRSVNSNSNTPGTPRRYSLENSNSRDMWDRNY